LSANILETPFEIEEIANLATRMKICGYYAARHAAAEADILVVPY
jgi:hypothetical protein